MNYSIRSTSFSVSYDAGSDTFTFTTNGYGHGVGMPQYGAQYYALYGGYTYDQILTHYYSGTEVH
jgi:stage II sporulation protein D